jgi:hypothetical protein
MDIAYIDKCRYEIEEENEFRYGIPAHTGPLEHWIWVKNAVLSVF